MPCIIIEGWREREKEGRRETERRRRKREFISVQQPLTCPRGILDHLSFLYENNNWSQFS